MKSNGSASEPMAACVVSRSVEAALKEEYSQDPEPYLPELTNLL